MLITPRKTDMLDTLPSEIFSTPKRPLRDRSLSSSPSRSSPRGKMASSPEKGVTFSTTSFYKPRMEYLNPFERMVAGKPKIYVTPPVLKLPSKSSKVRSMGKQNSVSRNSQKPLLSKTLKSSVKVKQVVKPSKPALEKGVSNSLALQATPTKRSAKQKPNYRKSPSKIDAETNPKQLPANSSDGPKDSKESTPTKRTSPRKSVSPDKRTSPGKTSPRKSVSPGKRTSPGKTSPRKRRFFVVRSPARDRKRWMSPAYAKTNFSLDFNKASKPSKRSSPKSETKKKIRFDQTSEEVVTPNRPKKIPTTSTNTPTTRSKIPAISPANTPNTRSSKRPVTPIAKDIVQNSSEEKLATPIKRRKIEVNSANTPTASTSKSLVGSTVNPSAKSPPEGESRLSNCADECSLNSSGMECENGVADGDASHSEDLPVPVQTKKQVTPSKKDGASGSSSPRCYPIFEVNDKSKARSPNVQPSPQRSSPRTKSKRFMKSNGADQMIIDAGQRDFGAKQCPSCGMVYSVGEAHDEMIHSKYHEEFHSVLRFPGWKKERVVGEFTDGRVIKVLPSDPAFMMRKVEDVRALVDRDLGFCVFSLPSNPHAAFFLYVTLDKKIVGCVIAETITNAYRVLPSSDTPNGPPQTTKGWYCSTEPSKALCGISRVWTEPMHRRQKVATRLIDSLRGHFLYGQVMTVDDIAFSDPTPSGREFATKYTGTETFLVYK